MGKRIFAVENYKKMLTRADKKFSFNVGEMIEPPSTFLFKTWPPSNPTPDPSSFRHS
jgi:hypothetical protein